MQEGTPEIVRSAEESKTPQVSPLVYHAVIDATFLPVMLSGMRLEIHGRENIPAAGSPLLIAGNHQTGLDPFILARALPKGRFLQFMAKKELFIPVIGDIISAGGSFPVDRQEKDVRAIRMGVRILKNNGTLGMFPAGTRGSNELHKGAAMIAARGRAPILPVGLSRSGRRWIVRFGQPLPANSNLSATTEQLAQALCELSEPIGQAVESGFWWRDQTQSRAKNKEQHERHV